MIQSAGKQYSLGFWAEYGWSPHVWNVFFVSSALFFNCLQSAVIKCLLNFIYWGGVQLLILLGGNRSMNATYRSEMFECCPNVIYYVTSSAGKKGWGWGWHFLFIQNFFCFSFFSFIILIVCKAQWLNAY